MGQVKLVKKAHVTDTCFGSVGFVGLTYLPPFLVQLAQRGIHVVPLSHYLIIQRMNPKCGA